MKPTIISIVLVALVGSVNPIPTENAPEPVQATLEENVQTTKNINKTPEKRSKTVWRDNPNGCDTKTEYIRADNFKCIKKPVTKVATVARSVTTHCADYRHLVEQYNWNVDTMMYAMKHESGCNPNAVGDNYVINGVYAPSCGLFQVRTLSGRPSCEQLKDPELNVKTAYIIWTTQGYNAWTVLH